MIYHTSPEPSHEPDRQTVQQRAQPSGASAGRVPIRCQGVFIRQDPDSGDVILSRKPANWDGFLRALTVAEVPSDFLGAEERCQALHERDELEGVA